MKAMKQYVKPEMLAIEVEPACLLAGSEGESDYANPEEAPGELYDEIGMGEGYRKEFD